MVIFEGSAGDLRDLPGNLVTRRCSLTSNLLVSKKGMDSGKGLLAQKKAVLEWLEPFQLTRLELL